jgi:hypothetical protein
MSRKRILRGLVPVVACAAAALSLSSNVAASASVDTSHGGSFSVETTAGPNHWATPSYGTYDTASTCVDATFALKPPSGSPIWIVRLVWYDGGANKTLWAGYYTGVGRHCSPTIKISAKNDKVYDVIIVDSPFSDVAGTYGIDTN